MTLTTLTFEIRNRDAVRPGLAVVYPAARSASVLVAGEMRLRRQHASAAQWKEVEREMAAGLQTGPMTAGVFHALLTESAKDRVVAYLHAMPIEVTDPLSTVLALDKHLKNQPLSLRLGMLQN